jgi:hypothetical protein
MKSRVILIVNIEQERSWRTPIRNPKSNYLTKDKSRLRLYLQVQVAHNIPVISTRKA